MLTLVNLWSNEPERSVTHLQTRTILHVPFAPEVVLLHKVIFNWESWWRGLNSRRSYGLISIGHR